MATRIDKEACREAYNRVRDDGSAVIWVTFRYDGATIVPGEQGAEYQHFIQQCTEFREGVRDQRPEGAGGGFHQERAEEGGGRQLRCPDGVTALRPGAAATRTGRPEARPPPGSAAQALRVPC
ncbi:coactosin-like protein isoform X2 [Cavia porcellus]|uniref:coactosin-like protein isoform X2 n=1 Tax=Cavia porcellus TaxID=10141 RepID=UPI002FE175CD